MFACLNSLFLASTLIVKHMFYCQYLLGQQQLYILVLSIALDAVALVAILGVDFGTGILIALTFHIFSWTKNLFTLPKESDFQDTKFKIVHLVDKFTIEVVFAAIVLVIRRDLWSTLVVVSFYKLY